MRKLLCCFLFLFMIFSANAQFTDLVDFNGSSAPQGLSPYGSLSLSVTGDSLFGMTAYGGASSAGNIFCYSSSGYTDLFDFDGINELYPYGSLTVSGSVLYGMTCYGGAYNAGNVFSINTNGSSYSDILDFNGSNGAYPYGNVILSNDTLFGMTTEGGSSNDGSIFCVTTGGAYADLFDFNGTNGAYPNGSLTFSITKDSLYGMTNYGGAYSYYGNIFSITKTGSNYADLLDFDGTNGGEPFGSSIASVTGDTLYGMSFYGGYYGYGNIFSLVYGSGYNDILDFNITNGASPNGDLTLSGGLLYGMATTGGANNAGDIFSVYPDGSGFADMVDFGGRNGTYPFGSLTFSRNRTKFFGMTSQGGANGDGLMFDYNLLTISGFKVVNVTCTSGSVGSAEALVSGGTAPYTYSWNPGGNTNQTITGLSLGSYTVTVTDNSGSTATSVAIISGVFLRVSHFINVNCYGGNSGQIQAFLSGGTAPYSFTWSGGGSPLGPTDRRLTAGTYTVTVTDSCGMTATASATITQPTLLSVWDSVTANVHCSGTSTGSILATASGGASPYTYLWSDAGSQTTAAATGLSAGTYYITVTDTNGCSAIDSATVSQPAKPALGVTIARAKNVSCSGSFDGMALALASGGTPPFSYMWSPGGETTSIISGLSAGIYNVLTTDTRGCDVTATANITQPSALVVTDTTIASLALALPSGGTPPYSFTWSPGGSTSSMTSSISAGTYTVIVTDANACQDSALVVLKNPLSAGLNLSLYYSGSTCADNPSWASFAVFATSLPNTVFHSCVVDVKYSHNEFYPDSVGGFGLLVYPDVNFLLYDYLNVSQLSDSVIEIQFGDSTESASIAATENLLDDSAQPLFYIQLQIESPCQSGTVSFTNTLTTMSKSNYTDSALVGGNYVYSDSAYTTVYTNTLATSPACDGSISISGWSNPVYGNNSSIDAGTNSLSVPSNSSILTITGTGFGNTKGFVAVTDANEGAALTLDDTDILSWTENQIIIKMPSYSFGQDSLTPGSGPFTITNTCGDIIGDTIQINYNIINKPLSTEKIRPNIVMVNDTESFNFVCDTSVSHNHAAFACVKKAIRTWNCYTGVNWKLSNNTNVALAVSRPDGISDIYFSSHMLIPGDLMEAAPWYLSDTCYDSNDSVAFMDEADINILRNQYLPHGYRWSYDTSGIMASSDSDYFYEAILHELGHAHGLSHINDSSSLMFRTQLRGRGGAIDSGSTYPGSATLLGALDMIFTSVLPADSPGNLGCAIFARLDTIPRLCFDATLSIPVVSINPYNLNLYPNPINSGDLTLTYELTKNSHVQFNIIDCLGRVVMVLDNKNKPLGDYSEQINIDALAGAVYLFTANINGELQVIKFIKL